MIKGIPKHAHVTFESYHTCQKDLYLNYSKLEKTSSLHLSLSGFKTREGFLRKNIVAVSFFQNCAIHQYS